MSGFGMPKLPRKVPVASQAHSTTFFSLFWLHEDEEELLDEELLDDELVSRAGLSEPGCVAFTVPT